MVSKFNIAKFYHLLFRYEKIFNEDKISLDPLFYINIDKRQSKSFEFEFSLIVMIKSCNLNSYVESLGSSTIKQHRLS